MVSDYFVKDFARMYLEEKGYLVATFVDKDNYVLVVNISFGMGGCDLYIDVTCIFDEEDVMDVKKVTKFLVRELEREVKEIK